MIQHAQGARFVECEDRDVDLLHHAAQETDGLIGVETLAAQASASAFTS
jgi:hypothetical protein